MPQISLATMIHPGGHEARDEESGPYSQQGQIDRTQRQRRKQENSGRQRVGYFSEVVPQNSSVFDCSKNGPIGKRRAGGSADRRMLSCDLIRENMRDRQQTMALEVSAGLGESR